MTISQINSHGLNRWCEEDRVIRVGPERVPEAAARLVGGGIRANRAAAEKFLGYALQNEIPLDLMWAGLDDRGRIVVSALAVSNPGRTAMLFASRAGSRTMNDLTAQVIDRSCAHLQEQGVRIAQALLEPREREERRIFLDAGFSTLATLSYLERSNAARHREVADPWPDDVSIESWREQNRDDFVAALAASYEDTLDCPGLTGLRATEDVLAGHRAAGQFEPELWTLLRIAGRPAGVLFLNPSPKQKTIELVYVGLAKWARGRDLGRRLLHRALGQASKRRERAITLAVDERNLPALRLYFRAGFRRLLRRVALIRVLNGICAPEN